MRYAATQCPRCRLEGIMWHDQSCILCPVCGPVPPDARKSYDEVLSRMQQLADKVAAHEAAGRQLTAEIADVMQVVQLELWLALARPATNNCAQKRAACNCAETPVGGYPMQAELPHAG